MDSDFGWKDVEDVQSQVSNYLEGFSVLWDFEDRRGHDDASEIKVLVVVETDIKNVYGTDANAQNEGRGFGVKFFNLFEEIVGVLDHSLVVAPLAPFSFR